MTEIGGERRGNVINQEPQEVFDTGAHGEMEVKRPYTRFDGSDNSRSPA
jgi:hypothetical protein